ncbi:MAG: ATP-dependent acyl-CoA ligase [Herpetosiphon sp.]
MDLWTFLERQVERTPDKTLLRSQGLHQSYAACAEQAIKAAGGLRGIGVRPGDPVCLMLRNSPDYVYAWFGLARLGAVAVPINVHLKGTGLHYIIEHSEARVLVIEEDLLPRVVELQEQLPQLGLIVVRGDGAVHPPRIGWDALLASGEAAGPTIDIDDAAVNTILYTSGTTGAPKGVMLSHRAYLNSARFFADQFVHATAEDTLYTSLPLFHINAQAHTVLPAIYKQATMALGESFSASRFWDEIRTHQATIFNSLAAMIPILLKQPAGSQDRNHGATITACAATPKDAWQQFEQRFGVRIIEGYGLTETTGFCVTNPFDAVRVGSMGKAMAFVEAAVVGTDDQRLPSGAHGEVVIRASAPHLLMEGYFKMAEQTAETMRNGWFHSGDMGFADEDGYLYFVDRIKQSIRRRGENISSWEIEKSVNSHPKVLESAAIGVPSELGEEDVKICVVTRPGEALEPLEIVQWCETRMAYFMVPRYVELRTELPKTATERVEKYKLKEEGIGGAWDREAAGYRIRRS